MFFQDPVVFSTYSQAYLHQQLNETELQNLKRQRLETQFHQLHVLDFLFILILEIF